MADSKIDQTKVMRISSVGLNNLVF